MYNDVHPTHLHASTGTQTNYPSESHLVHVHVCLTFVRSLCAFLSLSTFFLTDFTADSTSVTTFSA